MINLWSDFTVHTFTTQSMHIHKYVVDETEANKTIPTPTITPPTTITATPTITATTTITVPVRNIMIEQK